MNDASDRYQSNNDSGLAGSSGALKYFQQEKLQKGCLMMKCAFVRALSSTAIVLVMLPLNAFPQKDMAVPSIRLNPLNQKKDKVVGLTPQMVRRAYGFDQIANEGTGQTIAIVVAFNNPSIAADLEVFTKASGLPPCTVGNGCLEISGTPPVPNPAVFPPAFVQFWQLEAALDVQWAHAIAPQAKKVLVQANTAFLQDLLDAVNQAKGSGASVVSMSWGLPETRDRSIGGDCAPPDLPCYDFIAAGVSFVAASGDSGTPALWPATSSDVTAVGGTKLNTNSKGDFNSELSWDDSGGGLSSFVFAPVYQLPFTPENPQGRRGVPDVAYNADPNAGFSVYSSSNGGWSQVGGTSAGVPQWSALIAIVNSLRMTAGKALFTGSNSGIYAVAGTAYLTRFNDITNGPKNGKCGPLCKVGPGYDYLTGLGSPKANELIPALVNLP
jgi:subtilase family serine protease